MKKEIPKIFVNKINNKIDNNKEVYYSYLDKSDNNIINELNEYDLQRKIDNLFRTRDFIYKKKFHIKTKYEENDYYIISKSYDYLLTIDGKRIMINDIIDIY